MKNILIIRRDNIGDLVCTTPLIEGAKTLFPDAKIYLLINSMSQDVVKNNPYIERTFIYRKAKHAAGKLAKLGVHFERLKMFLQLRRIRFDAAILANPQPCKYSVRLAKMAGAKHIIGADTGDRAITVPFSRADFSGQHQVELTFSYLSALSDKQIPIPEVSIWLTEQERQQALCRIDGLHPGVRPGLGVHISSRSAKRRWPLERYVDIIQRYLQQNSHGSVLIFWSPQGALAPDDIGDQHRAEQVLAACHSSRVSLYPTSSVRELVAAYECCDRVLCSDGGQMHLAAAMNKKQVVLFGDTDRKVWHPWSGQYDILQTPSGDCVDVSADDVWQHLSRL
ncbi:glycosyltransferase family 9 protein [Erwinia amylovora]|uniref:Glycosyl transferase, family 9 n=4 Tax=Erwinia amylovora TaxID=552 RepID=A0A830ZPD9_ERWAM|nr:glycosyltransferase family 9 protein [Erwinia amylovora]CBX78897.1 Glycosyl transferase, family 9 [Erwinia amylovora ATCC BAA-2158]CDK13708.1 Glycosyl transferase, family 9 [Erwinia amylovora LA635]CDK17075.1 Glycosyl transferase, family 9 [Erwinia amylovora LA636]CDK20444.1 Glycosyl transferase, family 9 [Erwinia amylovora LA637]ATZ10053.1 lipopolysaccharide heptosyltransferase family protein [Erwinia amylovora]